MHKPAFPCISLKLSRTKLPTISLPLRLPSPIQTIGKARREERAWQTYNWMWSDLIIPYCGLAPRGNSSDHSLNLISWNLGAFVEMTWNDCRTCGTHPRVQCLLVVQKGSTFKIHAATRFQILLPLMCSFCIRILSLSPVFIEVLFSAQAQTRRGCMSTPLPDPMLGLKPAG